MERLSNYCSTHKWAYIVAWPILIVYIIVKIPQALKEWGQS
jgi:hypothetical protein